MKRIVRTILIVFLLILTSLYVLDDKFKFSSFNIANINGSIKSMVVYHYSANGKILEKFSYYYTDGVIDSILEYNINSFKSKSFFIYNGKFLTKKITNYKDNSNIDTETYEYDWNGKLIEVWKCRLLTPKQELVRYRNKLHQQSKVSMVLLENGFKVMDSEVVICSNRNVNTRIYNNSNELLYENIQQNDTLGNILMETLFHYNSLIPSYTYYKYILDQRKNWIRVDMYKYLIHSDFYIREITY